VAPALVLAAVPAGQALTASATATAAFVGLSQGIAAAPAILQGVGLFTLFDVFLI
jgi:malonyl CoA-acyl carrier protein transacylase